VSIVSEVCRRRVAGVGIDPRGVGQDRLGEWREHGRVQGVAHARDRDQLGAADGCGEAGGVRRLVDRVCRRLDDQRGYLHAAQLGPALETCLVG
jgi:hypothetical protein